MSNVWLACLNSAQLPAFPQLREPAAALRAIDEKITQPMEL
jgi:hypothetical protein